MSSTPEGKALKICILGTAYPFRGGLAAFNERLAKALIEKGNDVEILTFTLQYPGFLFPGTTQYSDGPSPEGLKIHRVLNSINPLSWLRTAQFVRRMKPDVLIVKFWLPFMAPAFGTVARLSRSGSMKRISILDNVIPHEARPGDKLLIRYFVKSMDGFIAMSRAVLDDLRLFETRKKCLFNPHPLYDHYGVIGDRETALANLGLGADSRYMLFFGLIRDYKGLDLLLRAIASDRFNHPDVKLIVAGEFYTDPEPYLNLIDELGISDKLVLHTRFIPDSQVADYFNAADIVVQPYKTATQSGVTQIAYHFEKPMLVSDVGGLAEIVPNGKAGYVVAPNEEEIAGALYDFFSYDRAAAMAIHVREEKQKYSWDLMIDKITALTVEN